MSDQEIATPTAEAVTTESAPVNKPVETQAPETEVQAAEDTESATVTEETSATVEEDKTPKHIEELKAQRKKRQEAEREAAYWRGQAEARAASTTEKPVQEPQRQAGPPVKPDPSNFNTYADYEIANEEYLLQAAEYRIAQRFVQQQAQVQKQNLVQSFERRIAEAAKEDPSIIDIRNDQSLPVNETMAEVLRRSEMAPQLLRWINSNREEAKRLTRLAPLETVLEMGRIEGALKAASKPPAPKKVSAAPAPIATVQSTSPTVIDEDNLPMEEYYRRRTKQMLGR